MTTAQEVIILCERVRGGANAEFVAKIKGFDDDRLARFTGVKKNLDKFRKGFEDFVSKHTRFRSFADAVKAFLEGPGSDLTGGASA